VSATVVNNPVALISATAVNNPVALISKSFTKRGFGTRPNSW